MYPAITISLVPEAKGGPFVYWSGLSEACADAAGLGFAAIEIFPRGVEGFDRAELKTLLRLHSLKLAAMGTGAGWVVHKLSLTHSDTVIRLRAREFIRSIIDLAGAFGAPAIIGSMQGRWEGDMTRTKALNVLAEALEDLGAYAATYGVPLLYEPLNRYETNLINRIGDTANWLRTLRTTNIRILADMFHMNMEESDLAAALREAGSLIGHVHFADSNRRAIGFGHTAILPIIAALREIQYTGALSAEILPEPDAATAARQTLLSFQRALATP
ncbi:MAG: sugar phosphate isomerase/epimerase family protein [Opitutaceae bacterium]